MVNSGDGGWVECKESEERDAKVEDLTTMRVTTNYAFKDKQEKEKEGRRKRKCLDVCLGE